MTKQILVCDDDPLFRKTLQLLLRDHGAVTTSQNTDEAISLLQARTFDLLLLDIQMRTPDEGLRALPRIRELDTELTVLMLSGLKDFAVVREALRSGADDYLTKDFEPEEFQLTIDRALGKHKLRQTNRKRNSETARSAKRFQLVGETPAILEIRKLIEKFRPSDANVLIRGETGTGKEIVARLLRKTGPDGELEPFVAIDSATLHAQTAESTLFGHERGAFTGAEQMRRGLFEEADGGVVFLDEIGNMPVEIQAKLLRVLQEKEVVRLGSQRAIPLHFRVIAATSRPLEEMVKHGTFLTDLLHRINILPITLPPLRERRADLALLATYLLQEKTGAKITITENALEVLGSHDWSGNVRELAALLDYSIAVTEDGEIDIADLHPKILTLRGEAIENSASRKNFYTQVADFEATLLRSAYSESSGNISKLALKLGMDRSHLHTKLKQHGIHSAKNHTAQA